MPSAREIIPTIKLSVKDFVEDECPRTAASLAYYTIFALPPLLILIVLSAR